MDMQPVESGAITHLGHEGDTLAVRFKSGKTYHFPNVTQAEYEALRNADSIGKHWSRHFQQRNGIAVKG